MAPPSGPAPTLTVADALRLPVLRRGLPEVHAGADALDRPIRWVHAGEAPSLPDLLVGGELLLTTGMGIGRTAGEQRRFVARLAEHGLAALVIELGSAHAAPPPALVRAAEEHDLPLIALRREVPFVAVTEAIHTEIVNSHYALLRRGEEIHRRLTALMLDGHGLPEVLGALAEMLRNPVSLERADGQLLYHAQPPGTAGDPRDAGGEETASAPVQTGGQRPPLRLVVAAAVGPLLPVTSLALGHAAEIVALALLRARQEEELVIRQRGNVLADLAAGRVGGADAARQVEAVGLRPAPELVLPVAVTLRTGAAADATDTAATLIGDAQRDLDARGARALFGAQSGAGRLLGVVALHDPAARAEVAGMVAAAARRAVARRLGPAEVVVAAGRPAGWDAAGAELRLAADCATAAALLPPAPWFAVEDLEVERLLWRWRGDEELAAFVRRVLGPLLDHDARRKSPLLPTLEALLANGGRKAEAARALHVNRQGLYHRIERLQRLLDADLDDAADRLRVALALHARRYVGSPPTT